MKYGIQEIGSSLNACFNSNAVVLVIWSRLGKGGSGISDKEFKICVIIRSARLNLTRVSELICPVFSEDLFDTLHHDQPMSDRIALSLAPNYTIGVCLFVSFEAAKDDLCHHLEILSAAANLQPWSPPPPRHPPARPKRLGPSWSQLTQMQRPARAAVE